MLEAASIDNVDRLPLPQQELMLPAPTTLTQSPQQDKNEANLSNSDRYALENDLEEAKEDRLSMQGNQGAQMDVLSPVNVASQGFNVQVVHGGLQRSASFSHRETSSRDKELQKRLMK